jgi:hypothetical protein
MSEGELERLRRALERLLNGQREALEAVERALEESEGFEQETTLVDVQDILQGAHEDARDILDGGEGREV